MNRWRWPQKGCLKSSRKAAKPAKGGPHQTFLRELCGLARDHSPLLKLSLVALALLVLFWPAQALAVEQCEALNPQACMDNFLHYNLVQLMRTIWFFTRPLLLIARWIEGLRSYLVDGVLATAFDATIAGVQYPFWMMAALAWCIFVIGYMLSIIADFRWVNLRRGVWYCVLAALLFQWGSQALAASEQLRAEVGQGFSQLAQQSVDQASGQLVFYAANDSSVRPPRSIYRGENDCPGASTSRSDPEAMHVNDYVANYLWATAADIHCPTATGGSSELPRAFAKGDGSFAGYVPKQPIDTEEKDERTRLISLAQDGVTRLMLGFVMAIAAVYEQVLYLIFTLTLATAWLGLLISLLFVLFVSGESMFTSQIRAGVTIMKTSWLASIWVGLMLALVRQAADTGNAMVVFGAVMLTLGVIAWQTKAAFSLFLSTLDRVGNTVLSGAPAAIGGMLRQVGMGAIAVATGGSSALALAGGMALGGAEAARNHKGGWNEAGGAATGEKSGSTAYGVGAALAQLRPLRRAGQLAKAMGALPASDPLVAGLTTPRPASPFAWAAQRRDRANGGEAAQEAQKRQEMTTTEPHRAMAPVPHRATPAPKRMRPDAPSSAQTPPSEQTPLAPAPTPAGLAGLPPMPLARQIGALAVAMHARPNADERAALLEQIRPLVEQFVRQHGHAPPLDPALPLRVTVDGERRVQVTLVPNTHGATSASSSQRHATPTRRRPPFRFVQRAEQPVHQQKDHSPEASPPFAQEQPARSARLKGYRTARPIQQAVRREEMRQRDPETPPSTRTVSPSLIAAAPTQPTTLAVAPQVYAPVQTTPVVEQPLTQPNQVTSQPMEASERKRARIANTVLDVSKPAPSTASAPRPLTAAGQQLIPEVRASGDSTPAPHIPRPVRSAPEAVAARDLPSEVVAVPLPERVSISQQPASTPAQAPVAPAPIPQVEQAQPAPLAPPTIISEHAPPVAQARQTVAAPVAAPAPSAGQTTSIAPPAAPLRPGPAVQQPFSASEAEVSPEPTAPAKRRAWRAGQRAAQVEQIPRPTNSSRAALPRASKEGKR